VYAGGRRAVRGREDLDGVVWTCGWSHSMVVSVEGRVWTFGCGEYCCKDRLVPTALFFCVCVDPQHFAHATISTIACGAFHSASVTAVVALYTWGQGGAEDTGPGARRPGKLLQTDMPILPTVEQARADAVAATVAGRDVRGSVPRAA